MKTNRLFSLKAMSNALRDRKVKKIEFVTYSIIFVLLTASIFLMSPGNYTSIYVFYATIISMLIFTPIWLGLAYVANKKGDSKDFWYRFISLNIIITIIVSIALFIFFFIFGLFYPIFTGSPFVDPNEIPKLGWLDFFFTSLLSIIYLYLIYKYMFLTSVNN